jgi:subtilisin family serine protease
MRSRAILVTILILAVSVISLLPQQASSLYQDLPEIFPLDTQTPLDMSKFDRDIDGDLVDDLLLDPQQLDIVDGMVGLNVHMSGPVTRNDVARIMLKAEELDLDPTFLRTGTYTTVIYLLVRPTAEIRNLWVSGVQFLEYRPMMIQFLDVSSATVRSTASSDLSPMTAEDLGITGEGVTVAVLDSGVDNNIHESLRGKYQFGVDFTGTTTIYGLDPDDVDGHGTHVAGTAIGTGGNSETYRGVAPGADLVDLKIFKTFGSILGNSDQAFEWLLENHEERGIDVVQCSFGSSVTTSGKDTTAQLANRLVDEGVVVVVAAGNDGIQGLPSPASADKVITVGAYNDKSTISRDDDNVEGFSNRGPRASDGDLDKMDELKPDLGAPGRNIRAPNHNSVLEYVEMTGTSMSCPHVSGVAALMLEANPELTPGQIKTILRDTSQQRYSPSRGDLDPKYNYRSGWGHVDAYGAVKRALDLKELNIVSPTEVASGAPLNIEVTSVFTKTSYDIVGDLVTLESVTPYSWGRPEDIKVDGTPYGSSYNINGPKRSGDNWVTTLEIVYNSSIEEAEPSLTVSITPLGESGDSAIIYGSSSINGMGFASDSKTINITEGPTPPDLSINPLAIWFSDNLPEGGEEIDITARINNTGGRSVENVLVRFLDGPERTGEVIGERYIDVPSRSYSLASVVWEANPGLHAITVIVDPDDQVVETDEDNNSAEKPITVRGLNPPPIAQLSVSPGSGSTITRFVFDGSDSQDTNIRGGNVVSYNFDFGDGTNSGWIQSSSVEHRYQKGGTFTASLRVRDNGGEESTNDAEQAVNVTDVTSLKKVLYLNSSMGLSEERGPASNISIPDREEEMGEWTSDPMKRTVKLHSLLSVYLKVRSSDPTIFSYSIEVQFQGSTVGPVADEIPLDGGTQLVQIDIPVDEILVPFRDMFSLRVSGSIEEGSASIDLGEDGSFLEYLYYLPDNQAPITDAGDDIEIKAGQPVEFSGEAEDPDGTILEVRWDVDDDGIFEETGENSFSYIYPGFEDEGIYTSRFIAIDNDGGSSEDTLLVTVRAEDYNFPPEIRLDCEPGALLTGTVTISGTAEDDVSIESVELRIRSILTGEVVIDWMEARGEEEWSIEVDTKALQDGEYDIEARAFDGSRYSEIAVCRVNVVNENVQPEIMEANIYPAEIVVGQDITITLTADVRDPDGPMESLTVTADLSSIGENADLLMNDDGEFDDRVEGDGIFTGSFEPSTSLIPGSYPIIITAVDRRGVFDEAVVSLSVQSDIDVTVDIYPRNLWSGELVSISVDIGSPGDVKVFAESLIFSSSQGVELKDDGIGSDSIAGDDIYTVETKVEGDPGEYVVMIIVEDLNGLRLYSISETITIAGDPEDIKSQGGGQIIGPLEVALGFLVILVIGFTILVVVIFKKREKQVFQEGYDSIVHTSAPLQVEAVEVLEGEVLSGELPVHGEVPEIPYQAHGTHEYAELQPE